MLLRIQSYYAGFKVLLQMHRSKPIQNLDTGIWRRDIQFTFQHGGCSRWEVEEVPQEQGVQFLFFPIFAPIPILSYFLTKTSYFSYFLAGEAKICNKIETGMFSCMCP